MEHRSCPARLAMSIAIRRMALVSALCLLGLVWLGTPARAITNGAPDGTLHPNVGAMLAQLHPGEISQVCSGTLIAPTVFLTAGHCTAYLEEHGIPADEVWVSFDPVWTPASPRLHGTYYTDPAFTYQHQSDPHDLAVIVLDGPVSGAEPAELPTIGLLDEMKSDGSLQDQVFTAVGYGVSEMESGPGGPGFPGDGVRKYATSTFDALNKAWLRLSQKLSHGDGGTCYGDSGGPNFIGDTSVIAAITSKGDVPCYATNVTYRLDTQSARSFLSNYVPVP